MSKHFIIYSHGFGVDKTGRGLFTDIAASLPNIEHVMFDYNIVDDANKTMTVSSLNHQSETLADIFGKIKVDNPDATIDLICHSMGCLSAALANPEGVRKTFFLAPPDNVDADKFKAIFSRSGAELNPDGDSKVPRRDGSTTIIPKDFWDSLSVNVIELFDKFSERTDLTLVEADHDEVVGLTNFSELNKSIRSKQLSSDHNFTGNAREELCKLVNQLIQ